MLEMQIALHELHSSTLDDSDLKCGERGRGRERETEREKDEEEKRDIDLYIEQDVENDVLLRRERKRYLQIQAAGMKWLPFSIEFFFK